ncbi:hypothetical protein CABS01_02301 [Colletotrichum abscissum]|uniref:uncharacterized protein n=1 Tax=Colletotrichum abscissum TaxID=1671311 RepID=UPI0027D7211A|nr:uncharacterized protein CABS01_02301 [Colletotrichum abscissum]KAK1488671.1 hypothetical protein CABS01_02301 [Colletotrichum abscissum]
MHAFTVLALLTASAVQLVAAGGFASTCSDMTYSGTTFTAQCKNNFVDPYFEKAPIDLSKCLANVGGKVVCRPKSPSFKFCDCGLGSDKKILNCRCTDSTGTKQPSSLNLDTCLTNNDGNLSC